MRLYLIIGAQLFLLFIHYFGKVKLRECVKSKYGSIPKNVTDNVTEKFSTRNQQTCFNFAYLSLASDLLQIKFYYLYWDNKAYFTYFN